MASNTTVTTSTTNASSGTNTAVTTSTTSASAGTSKLVVPTGNIGSPASSAPASPLKKEIGVQNPGSKKVAIRCTHGNGCKNVRCGYLHPGQIGFEDAEDAKPKKAGETKALEERLSKLESQFEKTTKEISASFREMKKDKDEISKTFTEIKEDNETITAKLESIEKKNETQFEKMMRMLTDLDKSKPKAITDAHTEDCDHVMSKKEFFEARRAGDRKKTGSSIKEVKEDGTEVPNDGEEIVHNDEKFCKQKVISDGSGNVKEIKNVIGNLTVEELVEATKGANKYIMKFREKKKALTN